MSEWSDYAYNRSDDDIIIGGRLMTREVWEDNIQIKGGKEMREYKTGATRSSSEGKYEYIGFNCPLVDERYGQYMNKHRIQEDGKLRISSNWKKGMPLEDYKESAGRHWLDIRKHWDGYEGQDTLEDSICALMFNLKGYLHEILKEKIERGKKGANPAEQSSIDFTHHENMVELNKEEPYSKLP